MKTNAARALDRLGIAYDIVEYDLKDQAFSAEAVAERLGQPAERVYKTLVVRGSKTGVAVAVLPANATLDLKSLARLAKDRKMEMVRLDEIEALTGYVRGRVTALAMKRRYPVYVDASLLRHDQIGVSAGAHGVEIMLSPSDYLRAVAGRLGPIAAALDPTQR